MGLGGVYVQVESHASGCASCDEDDEGFGHDNRCLE